MISAVAFWSWLLNPLTAWLVSYTRLLTWRHCTYRNGHRGRTRWQWHTWTKLKQSWKNGHHLDAHPVGEEMSTDCLILFMRTRFCCKNEARTEGSTSPSNRCRAPRRFLPVRPRPPTELLERSRGIAGARPPTACRLGGRAWDDHRRKYSSAPSARTVSTPPSCARSRTRWPAW